MSLSLIKFHRASPQLMLSQLANAALVLSSATFCLPTTMSTATIARHDGGGRGGSNTSSTKYMTCGANVPYCGVLVLERGDGPGNYQHDQPGVHGLWPENGNYGTSSCVKGGGSFSDQMPSVSCYTDTVFQMHEWQAHGECAAADPVTFFNQVCTLSAEPLQIMTSLKAKGGSLAQMVDELTAKGFPVYNPNVGNDQLALSVCAGSDAVWKFADVKEFASLCAN